MRTTISILATLAIFNSFVIVSCKKDNKGEASSSNINQTTTTPSGSSPANNDTINSYVCGGLPNAISWQPVNGLWMITAISYLPEEFYCVGKIYFSGIKPPPVGSYLIQSNKGDLSVNQAFVEFSYTCYDCPPFDSQNYTKYSSSGKLEVKLNHGSTQVIFKDVNITSSTSKISGNITCD